ncbi:MAG: hypothetical protein JHD16_12995 [Solirubrobacteraceae bacterium]|nr:hypothetical protein [Solirubrobacteraceae bacterium]
MPAPTAPPPAPTRTPRPPRRSRAGRRIRGGAPLSPLQAQVLIVGAALLLALLYLLYLRAGDDGTVRIEGNRVDVELSEFRLSPQSVSVPNGTIAVYATNKGKQVHNLQIETIVQRSTDEKADNLMAIQAMRPGETKSNNVTLPPGKYKWRSSIANDDDLGMYGYIEVRQ